MCFSSYRSNCRGVSIMFNNNYELSIQNILRNCDGNLIAIDMNVEGNNITLINIYMDLTLTNQMCMERSNNVMSI